MTQAHSALSLLDILFKRSRLILRLTKTACSPEMASTLIPNGRRRCSAVCTTPRPRGRIRGTRHDGKLAVAGLLRFDAGELDHLGPLLGFVGDEVAELGGRHRH